MRITHPIAMLVLALLCGCGSGSSPATITLPNPPDPTEFGDPVTLPSPPDPVEVSESGGPLPQYVPPEDRIDPVEAQEFSNSEFQALGEARSGIDGVGEVPATALARYVSAAMGDDGNPGTAGEPWQTLQHAADTVMPNTTVYVDDSGDYGRARDHA